MIVLKETVLYLSLDNIKLLIIFAECKFQHMDLPTNFSQANILSTPVIHIVDKISSKAAHLPN